MAKTLRSRIAAVAVAAVGMGLLQAAPSNAAADALSMSLRESNGVTVVGSTTASFAVVRVTVTGDTDNPGLSSTEKLEYAVSAIPAESLTCTTGGASGLPDAGDIDFTEASAYDGTTDAAATSGDYFVAAQGALAASGSAAKYYYLKVARNASSKALDCGAYTIRLTLKNAGGEIVSRTTFPVKFVSNLADSGAVLTSAVTGFWYANETITVTSTRKITATLKDANNGVIRTGSNAAPTLTGTIGTSTTLKADLTLADDGSSGDTATTGGRDGTYGAVTSGAIGVVPTATDGLTVTIKYGAAFTTTKTATVYPTPTATKANSTLVTTTTSLVASASDAANARVYTAPLSTTSIALKFTAKSGATTVVQDAPMRFEVVYGGSALVLGDLSPAEADYPKIVRTDNAGVATLTITNARPADGVTATVTVKGFDTASDSKTFLVTWKKSEVATITSDPNANFTAKLKSTNTITYTAVDAFGTPVSGATMKVTLGGANASTTNDAANITSKVTDANGQFTYTWTDAAALTTEYDTVDVAAVVGGATATQIKVTYKTTVPVIAKFVATYSEAEGSNGAYSPVPTTAIVDAAEGKAFLINTALDTTASLAAAAGDDVASKLKFRFAAKDSTNAAVSGVPTVITATAGGLIINPTTGKSYSTYTSYSSNVDFIVTSTATGDVTFTVTSGSVTSSATIKFRNAVGDARNVAFTNKTATGTAGASTLPTYTVKVTDRFGNAVSDAVLALTHTGVGSFAGGAKVLTYTTDDTGSFTFETTSSVAGTATVTARASVGGAAAQMADAAGYVGTTEVAGVAAGVRSVSATTTFAAAEVTKSAAEIAADAAKAEAAKAIAAADAAKAAAVAAADAAKAAADAAKAEAAKATAAVAALSTTVTSIQTAISTLVASVTATLTAMSASLAKIMKKLKI